MKIPKFYPENECAQGANMDKKGTVLITGSSGFIGSKLAHHLSHQYQVIGLDRDVPSEKIPGVSYYTVDLTSEENVGKTLQIIKKEHTDQIASVVHLAAYYSFAGEEDEKYQTITFNGTRSLINHLKRNFKVEQFIFSSTMLVYETTRPGVKVTDDSKLNPTWPYPKSKVRTENMLKTEHGDIPVVNLRIAGIYNDYCHSPTISNQIIRIHEQWMTSIPFPGNPHHGQCFLHQDDLIEALGLLVEKRKEVKGFETFLLGEEEVLTHKEMQTRIGLELYQTPWPVVRIPKFVATFGAMTMMKMPFMREPFIMPWMIPHADEHVEVDISKIKNFLQWSPKKSLSHSLPVMIKNLRNDPEKWYKINKIAKPFYRELPLIGTGLDKNHWYLSVFSIFLGMWLFANPFTFGKLESGEFWSQIISGSMVTILAVFTLFPTLRWMRWINAFIGAWIMFSPLVFSVASDAAYSNDTLLGGLIMLANIYTPSSQDISQDKGIPPGWTYNPSTAGQRLPIMFLAYIGFFLSRYLASYQLGHIDTIWEPFFADGTVKVLTSDVSKAFPVSDAGLGAMTYLLDVIAAAMGGRQRWKTMPWAVMLFGFMIIPTGVTSIVLIMLQPISVGAWCSICLMTAFVMLMMVPPAVDEVLASAQLLSRAKRQGKSFWKVFWLGSIEAQTETNVSHVKPQGSLIHLIMVALLGIWLMFTPMVFEISGLAANNIYIVAALITTFGIISLSEVARIVRLINVALGLWLALSGLTLAPMSEIAQWHSVVVGLVVTILSVSLGKRADKYGAADNLIHWTPMKT